MTRVQDQAAYHWPNVFNSPMEVSGAGEANVSVTDEQALSDAVSDPGRWRSRGSSSESPGSDGPGSASRSRRRRGRHRSAPARSGGGTQRLGCANVDCGQVFVGKNAKKDLRHHFHVESEACRPREGQCSYYVMWVVAV